MASPKSDAPNAEASVVDQIVTRARRAQAAFESGADQARYDRAALAAGWAIMEPTRNRQMAELAVHTTGLGNVADKITKNHRKTLGLLRDIRDAKTCGIIAEKPELGLTEIARPLGVVGAVVPSTNPVATPANNIINALKCGNAIVLSPSPKGIPACETLIGHIHAEFDKIGIDRDLVLMVPAPGSKVKTQRMLEIVDLVVVTGSQDNVRRAYSSGSPAIGVGAGNVTVIVDETADLADAAAKVAASKTFDNATSCSSENSLIVVDAIYDDFLAELTRQGGAILSPQAVATTIGNLWRGGHLNRHVLAKDCDVLIDVLGLKGEVPADARFLVAPTEGIGDAYPLSGEKLSLVVALYRAKDYADALRLGGELLAYQGAGHSIGIHTFDAERPVQMGRKLPTCRVIVNQAHCFATGGSFDNGMPFSLSMGCGSWGGNSIDNNLHWRNFMNTTRVVRRIPPNEPTPEEIFGGYWAEAGK